MNALDAAIRRLSMSPSANSNGGLTRETEGIENVQLALDAAVRRLSRSPNGVLGAFASDATPTSGLHQLGDDAGEAPVQYRDVFLLIECGNQVDSH